VATDVSFGVDQNAALRRRGLVAALEYRLAEKWTLSAGGGVTLGGDLVLDGDRYELGVGAVGQAGVAYRVLDGDGWEPFLLLGASFAASTAGTRGPSAPRTAATSSSTPSTAASRSPSARPSPTPSRPTSPCAASAGRSSGCWREPRWSGPTGRHFQFGGGLLASAGLIDAFVEIIPLGERSASVGAAVAF